MNLFNIFKDTANKYPNNIALINYDNEEYNYDKILKKIKKLSKKLDNLGIKKGHCIALHCKNGVDYILLTYAIWNLKCTVIPVSIELTQQEKHEIFHQVSIDFAISDNNFISDLVMMQKSMFKSITENIVLLKVIKQKKHPIGFLQLNTAFIRFSSGTTGKSKGVVLTHETIYDRINAANEVLRIDSNDKIICLMSMSYHFAVSIVSYLSFGATIVLCNGAFAQNIIKCTQCNKGTIIYASPFHYKLMADSSSLEHLESLRLAISTATFLPDDVFMKFYNKTKMQISQAYGIIEVGLPCINVSMNLKKRKSVGKVLSSYKIKLLDVKLCKNQQEIIFRGKGIFDAYYEPWFENKSVSKQNWFHTGDLGYLDKDGFLFIEGRLKSLIDIEGIKFFPEDVEKVIEKHPLIKSSHVYQKIDSNNKMYLCSEIICSNESNKHLTSEELKVHCAQYLTTEKIPREFNFVDKLTKTASGKLVRNYQVKYQ